MSDTTPDKGGGNLGFRPHELLKTAPASCMNKPPCMRAEKQAFCFRVYPSLFPMFEATLISRCSNAVRSFMACDRNLKKANSLSALETCPVDNTRSKPLHFRLHDQ